MFGRLGNGYNVVGTISHRGSFCIPWFCLYRNDAVYSSRADLSLLQSRRSPPKSIWRLSDSNPKVVNSHPPHHYPEGRANIGPYSKPRPMDRESPDLSQKPLLDKLGFKKGFTAAVLNAPPEYRKKLEEIGPLAVGEVRPGHPLDFIHFFAVSRSQLEAEFPTLKEGLKQTGMLWVSWPKRSSRCQDRLERPGRQRGRAEERAGGRQGRRRRRDLVRTQVRPSAEGQEIASTSGSGRPSPTCRRASVRQSGGSPSRGAPAFARARARNRRGRRPCEPPCGRGRSAGRGSSRSVRHGPDGLRLADHHRYVAVGAHAPLGYRLEGGPDLPLKLRAAEVQGNPLLVTVEVSEDRLEGAQRLDESAKIAFGYSLCRAFTRSASFSPRFTMHIPCSVAATSILPRDGSPVW